MFDNPDSYRPRLAHLHSPINRIASLAQILQFVALATQTRAQQFLDGVLSRGASDIERVEDRVDIRAAVEERDWSEVF
jgi:hypothetical protein